MADTYTTSLGLVKCEVGASRDSWGTKTNSNWDVVDQLLSQAMPIGVIADFAGPTPPSGWLIADGRLVSRVTYSALFAVIGTYWGAGDGSTNFALPNAIGRASVGPGTMTDQAGQAAGFSFATAVGFVWNTITQANLPNYALYCDVQGFHAHGGATVGAGAHSHTTDAQGTHNHDTGGVGGGAAANGDHIHATDVQGAHQHFVTAVYMNAGGSPVAGGAGYTMQNTGLQTDVQGSHSHTTSTAGSHIHAIYYDGTHAHNVYGVGDHAHGINGDGNHSHNVYLNGSGQLFEVMSPVLVVTKIIYAGKQASTMVALDAASASIALEGEANELAAIREELAALRALFAPARRVPSTPLRGTH